MSNPITGKKARALVGKGAVLVDVRDAVAYRDKSAPGSTNMSLRQLPQLLKYPKTTAVVLIGDPTDPATLKAAENYVVGYGFANTFTLGTIDNWFN